jgi:hypothetical protein
MADLTFLGNTRVINMPQVSLPPEITCDVVGCLDRIKDKKTLLACSLTCKAFLSTSRKTIFETVALFWPPDADSFNSRFIGLIRASPELGSSVRTLHLTFPNLDDATYIPNAAATLASLSKVTDLRIHYLNWNDTDADSRTALVSGFKTVKHLQLTFPKFEFSHEATEFIASFPLLTHLLIQGDAWKSVAPHPSYSPLPVNLTSVSIAADLVGVLVQLMQLEPHPKVQNLSLDFVTDDHNYNVTSLLETLGDDLREVVFLNSIAMTAGERALRSSQGGHTPKIIFCIHNKHLYHTQASTFAITPNSATSRIVSVYQTLGVRSANFFPSYSRRSLSK